MNDYGSYQLSTGSHCCFTLFVPNFYRFSAAIFVAFSFIA